MRVLVLAFAVAAALAGAQHAAAETYPARSITLVVPFPAGGPTDTLARIMAQRMTGPLGQSVIIENVSGANGGIGAGRVARAAPDGYTLILGNWNSQVANGAAYALQYDLVRDFAPVALLTSAPLWVTARADFPANSLTELIAWLKANPGKASAATVGVGSAAHVSGIYFQNQTGTSFQFVPYRGGAPAYQDLVAGQVDLMCAETSATLPYVRAGKIKVFAVMAKTRWFGAPDTPTIDEAGVPGIYISFWHGLWAPKATPGDAITKLNNAVVETFADPAVREKLAGLGIDIPPREQLSPEALGTFHQAEIAKWWPVIRAANIKAE
jgi:tripartite-type tricarboxylate transporter receptor subunit TctC